MTARIETFMCSYDAFILKSPEGQLGIEESPRQFLTAAARALVGEEEAAVAPLSGGGFTFHVLVLYAFLVLFRLPRLSLIFDRSFKTPATSRSGASQIVGSGSVAYGGMAGC